MDISKKREINYGASFLSQSGRFLNIDEKISTIDITDSKGKRRTINMNTYNYQ